MAFAQGDDKPTSSGLKLRFTSNRVRPEGEDSVIADNWSHVACKIRPLVKSPHSRFIQV